MTRHQKRLSAPNAWPVERKTETFTVKAGAGPHGEAGVPLLVLLRDVLGYVDSKKEARFALNEGTVLVNGDAVSDEQRPVGMFDILAFTEREEYYRVFPEEGGRLSLTPIDREAAGSRLGKIVGKQDVHGGETQLTLHDGTNVRIDEGGDEYGTNDSLVVDNDDKEIVAHFPFEEGALVTAVDGTHSGDIGEIDEITVTAGSGDNTVTVETDGGSFETIEDYVVVIDENFVDDDEDAAADADADEADADETDEAADDESADGGDDE
ncbi:30S ribosomal protein S4e [Halobellus marinus]|uniref:30S ribosomal protein S4e n=1 Tax=Halobellus TaxID=1073986 RepID=UPI0028AE651D|nr:30S ribosomal protein S4e [Halobellus sp. DFY28]